MFVEVPARCSLSVSLPGAVMGRPPQVSAPLSPIIRYATVCNSNVQTIFKTMAYMREQRRGKIGKAELSKKVHEEDSFAFRSCMNSQNTSSVDVPGEKPG